MIVSESGPSAVDRRAPPREGWLWRLERTLADALTADARRRAERHALRRALRIFAVRYPRWAASGFDADLLARRDGAEALVVRDPNALARAWTQRFRYHDERRRERDVRRLEPVADRWFGLLEAERLRLGLEAAGVRQGLPPGFGSQEEARLPPIPSIE